MKQTLILVSALGVIFLLWEYPVLYPLKLLVVFFHESSHALMTVFTGGEVIEMVIANGGIEYSEKKMFEYKEKALALIKGFPDNPSKNALIGLVDYSIARNK